MTPPANPLHAGASALLKLEMLSANLAIGTACAFVFATAAASLAVDRETVGSGLAGSGLAGGAWSLRGSLRPTDVPSLPGRHDVREVKVPAQRLVARL